MNENEGGSAYPPNPDVKSGSCLIAGFQPLTVFHPSYWNAYKAASCGHMLAHYRRDESSLGRENIDPTRTKDNYTLGLDDRDGKVGAMDGIEPNWATVEGRIEGVNKAAKAAGKRAVRKELGALAAEAQQMRKSGKQLESERASGRPESRSKGVDR